MRLCFGRLSVSCLLFATVVLWWKKATSLLVLLNSLDICLIPVFFFSGAKLNVLVANLGALIALTIFLTSSVVTTIVPAGLLGLGPFVFSELGFFLLLQLDAM